MQYRTIWISDIHLGSRHAQSGRLLSFLRDAECEHLYLVGDIIDGWELRRRWLWDQEANTVVQKILRKNRKDTKVTYVYGNHDEFVEHFAGLNLGGVRFVERAVHTTADRQRYLVIHGHQLDGLVHFNRLLERVGSRLYDWILLFNLYFNRVRRRLGFGYWSVSSWLKFKAKSAVRYVTQFEDGMAQIAAKSRVDGVICGHIHRAENRQINGVHYLNCGDWVESCTALVEHFDGSFEILNLSDISADGRERDPADQEQVAQRPATVTAVRPAGRRRPRGGESEPELAGLF
jgi:UDP-2,3-diacylglucosamine pyrophosphatase LpxH